MNKIIHNKFGKAKILGQVKLKNLNSGSITICNLLDFLQT
jgi:hypothetical protein